jgi:hypothetical protein
MSRTDPPLRGWSTEVVYTGATMSKHRETYVFRCSDRTCTVVIRECRDHVKFDLTMSKYGRGQDEEAFEAWIKPLVERYENDPRPVVMPHPLTGQTAIVGGVGPRAWLMVCSPRT